MNIEFIIENASKIILIVAAICTLISVITEFTKGIGFLDKIPTKFQVLILSLFENDVKTYGTQTSVCQIWLVAQFENDEKRMLN